MICRLSTSFDVAVCSHGTRLSAQEPPTFEELFALIQTPPPRRSLQDSAANSSTEQSTHDLPDYDAGGDSECDLSDADADTDAPKWPSPPLASETYASAAARTLFVFSQWRLRYAFMRLCHC